MEKIEYRAYIKNRALLGVAAIDIWNELNSIKEAKAPSYSTVVNLAAQFKSGRESIEDKPRIGRPITTHTPANIERVRLFIKADPHCTYDEIEAATSIDRHILFDIIHASLKMRKLASRWIPHYLSPENRKKRVDICKENLAKFSEGKWRLGDVVTGDESWFYLRQVGRKSNNATWVAEGEHAATA